MENKAIKIQKSEKDRKDEWLNEMVQFEFYNLEEPGVPLKFTYGSTKKPEKYLLMHGGKYTYPRYILQHIESRQTPIWTFRPTGTGQLEKQLSGYKSRFQCRQTFA